MSGTKRQYGKSHGEKQGNKAEMVKDGAGEWKIMPNGKFYDPVRKKWIIRCRHCKKTFYASRPTAKTCSNAHRTAMHRAQTSVVAI